MTDMPRRIWAWPAEVTVVCEGEWHSEAPDNPNQETEYVRVDLYNDAVAHTDSVEAKLVETLDALHAEGNERNLKMEMLVFSIDADRREEIQRRKDAETALSLCIEALNEAHSELCDHVDTHPVMRKIYEAKVAVRAALEKETKDE